MARARPQPVRIFRYKENDVRIICDHCERPISGTVKRLAGHLNLHPACLTQLGKDQKRGSNQVPGSSVNHKSTK